MAIHHVSTHGWVSCPFPPPSPALVSPGRFWRLPARGAVNAPGRVRGAHARGSAACCMHRPGSPRVQQDAGPRSLLTPCGPGGAAGRRGTAHGQSGGGQPGVTPLEHAGGTARAGERVSHTPPPVRRQALTVRPRRAPQAVRHPLRRGQVLFFLPPVHASGRKPSAISFASMQRQGRPPKVFPTLAAVAGRLRRAEERSHQTPRPFAWQVTRETRLAVRQRREAHHAGRECPTRGASG